MGIDITMYDLVIVGLFVLLVGRGLWVGFLKQIIVLLSLYLGYIVAGQYHDRLFPFLKEVSANPKVIFLTAYALLFIGAYIGFMLLGKGLSFVINVTIAGWFDRLLGGVLGVAKAAIVAILLHMILGTVLAPENRMLADCQTCPTLGQAVEITRGLIKNERVREALKPQEAAISMEQARELLSPSSKAASASVE